MTLPIIVVRPEPGLSATLAAARAAGLPAEGHPLASVAPIAWQAPSEAAFDALLLGSANAVRHAGAALSRWRGGVAHVVGGATADAARDAGLRVGLVGEGGLQHVVEALRPQAPVRLLRLAGERHRPLSPPPGVSVETRVVYRVDYGRFPPGLAERLGDGALVLLHSGEAARHFTEECDRCGVSRGAVAIAALAPRIAQIVGEGWRETGTASHPSDSALLALARDMCH